VKVFISHSTADKWAARKISEDLERLGITTFLDEKDIQTGDSIDSSIAAHLADSEHFLILLSPASVHSHWVLIELGGAIALKKHLVPVLLYLGTNEIPKPITRFLARDINDLNRYYEELLARPAATVSDTTRPARRAKPKKRGRRALKVGDRVRLPVKRPTLDSEDEQIVAWVDEMDAYLDKEAAIVSIEKVPEGFNTYHIDLDGGEWMWVAQWLTPVPVKA
jgi:hypothetical protein